MRGAVRRVLCAGALAGTLGLLGCAEPTPYQPADGGYGYATQAIEDDRFRVSFSGNAITPRETVENYLLYRAAELTLEQGGDYFIVLYKEVQRDSERGYGGPAFSPSFGLSQCLNCGYWDSSFFVFGGYTPGFTDTRYLAFIEIVVRQGRVPNDPHAYDARAVLRRLGPAIVRKEADGG